jgi:signal transduction histidine kinase
MVTDIHESSDRLIEIVNDFLDVSRLEQGRIEFHLERLSVAKVIEEVVYGMTSLLKQKGLKMKLSANIRQLNALPDVIVDKNRLKQVFFNLLGNAVKFTKKGSISIEAELERDYIRISVTDTGMGISSESQTLLFRKFQQASDSILTRDSSNGTGLGLYISKLLASGMGGELGLDSSVLGKGSVFFVKVPVVTPARLKHMNDAVLAPDFETGLMIEKKP